MRLRQLSNKTASALFAFALLCGIGIASNATANAQYRTDTYQRDQQDRDRRDQQDRDRDRDYRDQRRRDRDYDRNGRGRDNDGYGNYGGSYQLRQTALNAGANEGNKAGRDDRNHGRSFEFQNKSAFQKGTKDYSSRLGDRETYKRYFREAFEHGYSDGYRGY